MTTYLLCQSYASNGEAVVSPMRAFESRADAEAVRNALNYGRVHHGIEYIVMNIDFVPAS